MNIDFADERYRAYTRKASDIVRPLGFAVLGIFWIFTNEGKLVPPAALSIAVALSIMSLVADLLQYVSAVFVWHRILKGLEKNASISRDTEFLVPGTTNRCANIFFVSKIVFMTIAYLFILFFLASSYAESLEGQIVFIVVLILFTFFLACSLFQLYKSVRDVDRFVRNPISRVPGSSERSIK